MQERRQRAATLIPLRRHSAIDSGLQRFLDSHQQHTRAIDTALESFSCYRGQGDLLGHYARVTAQSFRQWIEDRAGVELQRRASRVPPGPDDNDDFIAALQLEKELRLAEELILDLLHTEAKLEDWDMRTSQIAALYEIFIAERYYQRELTQAADAMELAKREDHAALIQYVNAGDDEATSDSDTISNGTHENHVNDPYGQGSILNTTFTDEPLPVPPSRFSLSSDEDILSMTSIERRGSTISRPSPTARMASQLFGRMRDSSQIKDDWIGVGKLERLRALTPKQARVQSFIDKLVDSERKFIKVLEDFKRALVQSTARHPSSSHGAAEGQFDHIMALLSTHKAFLEEVLNKRESVVSGYFLALILIQHLPSFVDVHTDFARKLPSTLDSLANEIRGSQGLERFMKDLYPNSGRVSIEASQRTFLLAPIVHVEYYCDIFRGLIIDSSQNTEERPILSDAFDALRVLVMESRLLCWQKALTSPPEFPLDWSSLSSKAGGHDLNHAATRQEAIFSLIEEEMQYIHALEAYRDTYLNAIKQPRNFPVSEDDVYQDFVDSLWSASRRAISTHKQLLRRLHSIQLEELPIVSEFCQKSGMDQIDWYGVYAQHLKKLSGYLDYGQQMMMWQPFRDFIKSCVPHKDLALGEFQDGLSLPLAHIRKSIGLFRRILDATTPDDHPDVTSLASLIAIFNDLQRLAEPKRPSLKFSLDHYISSLKCPDGCSLVDVNITSPDRKLIQDGAGWLYVEDSPQVNGQMERMVPLLLDNYVLLTTPRSLHGLDRHVVIRQPIPLELLDTSYLAKPTRRKGSTGRRLLENQSLTNKLTFRRRDRPEETVLILESQDELQRWLRKMKEAVETRVHMPQLYSLQSQHPSIRGAHTASPCTIGKRRFFVYALRGELGGVWIIEANDTSRPHQRLQDSNVQQLAVIGEVLLILKSDCIFGYHLSDLLSLQAAKTAKPWEIDSSHQVLFFRVHKTKSQTALVVVKWLRVGYQVVIYDGESLKLKSTLGNRKVVLNKIKEKQCNLREPPTDILLGTIAITTRGFHFLSDASRSRNSPPSSPSATASDDVIPSMDDPQEQTAARCRASKPLSMHTVGGKNLLCYPDFGVYANGNDGLLTGVTLRWECTPVKHVVWSPPHVLLFSARCVEIREMDTGALLQLIVGPQQQRLVCDGRGIPANLGLSSILVASPNEDGRETLWAVRANAE